MEQDDFNRLIRNKVSELDNKSLPLNWNEDDLWKILQRKQKKVKQVYWISFSSSIAACIILILSIAYFQFTKNNEHITIKYGVEIENKPEILLDSVIENQAIHNLIEEQCRLKSAICQTEEFRDLKNQLKELEDQSEKLDNQLKLFGNDPLLIRARSKIKTTRGYVEKELLQMIRS